MARRVMKPSIDQRVISCDARTVIGADIRTARHKLGKTLDEIAVRLNVTPQALSRIELGRNTNTELLAAFARAVGLEIVAQPKGGR